MSAADLTRTDRHLIALLGRVEDLGDCVAVRSLPNPHTFYGNHLFLPGPPEDLDAWIARFEDLFPGFEHVCLRWDDAALSPALLVSARERGLEPDDGVAMSLDAVDLEPRTDLDIRPLGLDGFERAMDLDRLCHPGEDDGAPGYAAFLRTQRGIQRRWVESGDATWWGCFDGDRLVGACGFADCGDVGRFQSVQTHPEHRRQGVCSSLVATVSSDGLRRGLRRVLLAAEPDGPALGTYRRIGFREVGGQRALIRAPGEQVRIRPELLSDRAGVNSMTTAAFESPGEAALLDLLRDTDGVISLVAERSGRLLGHAFFSPVRVGDRVEIALGPMCARPGCQRQGIGSALIRAGLERCRAAGHRLCFVLGHPEYYPRLGFAPSDLRPKWHVPRDVFMVQELVEGGLEGLEGDVAYHPAFDGV